MLIRVATAADTNSLVEFNQAMAFETEHKNLDAQVLQSGVEAIFQDERKGFYAVAESGGKIIGGLMVTFEWSDWRSQWFWWIQSVYVLPEKRGQGIYRKLYDFVKKEAQMRNDVCGFRLYVEKENTAAQNVYKKLGMAESYYLIFEETL
ncbi:MAG: GNAT family N-acetyltransferase [Pyrinomonadaceae bacterium]